jgi:hypothetical protein
VLQKRRTCSNVAQVVAHRTPAVTSRGFADAAPHRAVGAAAPDTLPRLTGRWWRQVGDGGWSGKQEKEASVGSRRQVKPAESHCDGEGGEGGGDLTGRRRIRRPRALLHREGENAAGRRRPAPDPATSSAVAGPRGVTPAFFSF